MQALLSAESCRPMNQSGKYGIFVGWVVGASIWLEVSVGGFVIYLMILVAIRSPQNVDVRGRKVAVCSHLLM
jgi:hypothetical protein